MFKALTPLVGIIIAIGLFFSYIRPTFRDVRAIQNETAEYTQATEKASELRQRINELKQRESSIASTDRARLEALIPDRVDEVSVLIDIDVLAVTHHLTLGDIAVGEQAESGSGPQDGMSSQPSGARAMAQVPGVLPGAGPAADEVTGLPFMQTVEPAEDKYTTLDIGFSVTGTYDDFRLFLADIERSLVLMEVTKITFARSEEDTVPFTLNIRLYSLNAPES